MQYRNFRNLGFKVSTFGVGAMRMPIIDGNESKINEPEAIKMIRTAIDNGVNYLDTAYGYHGGNSEILVGKALKDGYREKVILTSKLPVWLADSYEDFDKLLNEQLKRLEVDYLDFYLLHALNRERWDKILKLNVFDFLEKALKDGKIKHIGFSFHDTLEVFKEIIDYYNWDMCQIQLNILDDEYQAGVAGLKYAGEKNIPVVIMEPLKGGQLAKTIPDKVKNVYNNYAVKYSPIEWAFKYVANFSEVVTILSGVNNTEQAMENIRILSNAKVDSLSKEDKELLKQVKDIYYEKMKVGCTACNYCMPCPSGVKIPNVFGLYNEGSVFVKVNSKIHFDNLVKTGAGPDSCIECGNCEEECPQHIEIIKKLKEAEEYFRS